MAEGNIIIKKIKKVEGGAHGGAWKVAYADFVTAMMAFFLLLWLLNVTTDEQKSGIADYFAPTTVSFSRSGSGGVMGGLTLSSEGAKSSDSKSSAVVVQLTTELTAPTDVSKADSEILEDATDKQLEEEMAAREQSSFEEAQTVLEATLKEKLEEEDISDQVKIDTTEEGMRIQIVDQEGGSMFIAGTHNLTARSKKIVQEIAEVIGKLPNDVSISGHTDASPYDNKKNGESNWELSSGRANASRRVLQEYGVAPERIARVIGKADQDPLTPEDPFLPENRRISIILLRRATVLPPSLHKE
ncbi:MAG: OmpA family protein [Alphaproteobacteria bacterium]|jgi:chemotaxis protein MotB|nr:OmpA family protein [Alphaproteobacteria bacterium]MBT4084169.1 OmpA family protein [Alphaproteobacteria bacterium]MBT4545810.1 OmpA family protein [Alphaproteobacteria bacterium]MBT7747720.1 OmpA family protein [Alphaproteobacteria bacterium]